KCSASSRASRRTSRIGMRRRSTRDLVAWSARLFSVILRWPRSGPRRIRPRCWGRRPSRLAALGPQGDGNTDREASLLNSFKTASMAGLLLAASLAPAAAQDHSWLDPKLLEAAKAEGGEMTVYSDTNEGE